MLVGTSLTQVGYEEERSIYQKAPSRAVHASHCRLVVCGNRVWQRTMANGLPLSVAMECGNGGWQWSHEANPTGVV